MFSNSASGSSAGFIAHRVAHITESHDGKYVFRWTLIASAVSLGFNVIADPVAGYLYKNFILGIPEPAAKIMTTWAAGVTLLNAVAGTVVVVAVYTALRADSPQNRHLFSYIPEKGFNLGKICSII